MNVTPVRIVSATRATPETFERETLLGASLKRLKKDQLELAISYSNEAGLPAIYNREIAECNRQKILVFVHDDVWIDDFFFALRVSESLDHFDVVGVAGNRRGGPEQCSWAFLDRPGAWDVRENLSGAVAHEGRGVSWYGPVPQQVKLLDGLLLAARADVLSQSGVRFDLAYSFHFYDVDFCRSAAEAGLRLGTWPIAVTHGSGGNFRSKQWREAAAMYFAKWGARV